MTDNIFTAEVKRILENRNELVVTFENNARSTSVIKDQIDYSEGEIEPGDIVKVIQDNNLNETYADDILTKYEDRNLLKQVAIVKEILEEKVILQAEDGILSVQKPDTITLTEGNIVELNGFGGIQSIISEEPVVSFDHFEGSSDDISQRYKVDPDDIEDGFDDIGGLKEVLEKVRDFVELPLQKSEELEEVGVDPPTGILFSGPPGTGKTLTAKAVAKESQSAFYAIKGPELVSKWYGETEKDLRRVFEHAKEQDKPAIIFFDEIESLAGKREGARDVERRIISQLLTLMEGFQSYRDIVVIGATNRPEDLDPALRRPGRFDIELSFPKPNYEERLDILNKITRDLELGEVNLEKLSKNTEERTGAYLDQLFTQAGILAVKDDRTKIRREDIYLASERVSFNSKTGDKDGD